MAQTETKGKDVTLFDALRELEEEVEKLEQLLEIASLPNPEQKAIAEQEGATERRVLNVIDRLTILRHQVVESARLVERLTKAIGG